MVKHQAHTSRAPQITREAPPASEPFKFSDAAPREPSSRELATGKFEEAFTAIAKSRASEVRREILSEAEALARIYVEKHMEEISEGLQLD